MYALVTTLSMERSFQPINTPAEGEEFLLKPMNCPHHCEIYKTKPRSYKDLPIRLQNSERFTVTSKVESFLVLQELEDLRKMMHIFSVPRAGKGIYRSN